MAEEWESLLSAGIPVTETLDILGGGRSGKEKILLGEIKATIEAGHSIAESLRDPVRFRLFTALAGRRAVGNDSGTAPPGSRAIARKKNLLLV
ncbi:MAG: type II secretion system F family protein [Dialister invisus]